MVPFGETKVRHLAQATIGRKGRLAKCKSMGSPHSGQIVFGC